jgi:HD-GYP domain-containing protein (c-di-GMP phosphodiesterase class II)
MAVSKPSVDIYTPQILITSSASVIIMRRMLGQIGRHIYEEKCMDYIQDCERTAYIAVSIIRQGHLEQFMPVKDVFLLSLFSCIGSYRFMQQDGAFSEKDTAKRDYTYSYYFLKYMSPFGKDLRYLQFYNSSDNPLSIRESEHDEYARLIFFVVKAETYLKRKNYEYTLHEIEALAPAGGKPDYIKLFFVADRRWNIVKNLRDGSFLRTIDEWCNLLSFNAEDTFKLIKMLIYIMDFKSTATVAHTINTACYASVLGELMHCTENEIDELYTAGLLHDIGKMAINSCILESPAKLSEEDMKIMRTHVAEGERMIHGVVPQKLELISSRHHEKLDGSGYPQKLTEKELSLQDRILAISDITSALTDTRSYKGAFSKEKTVRIIKGMTKSGKLDSAVTEHIITEFDSIKTKVDTLREPMAAEFGRISAEFEAEEETELI